MRPRINIITLSVDDLDRTIAFYRDGLGLPTDGATAGVFGGESYVTFAMNDNLSLVFYPRNYLAKIAGEHEVAPEIILTYLADSRDEVDAIAARAVAAGGRLLDEEEQREQEWGYVSCFTDPDRYVWEILWESGRESD